MEPESLKKNNDSRCRLNKILLNTNNIVWSTFRESFVFIQMYKYNITMRKSKFFKKS